MTFDSSKPVQTRDGRKARIICTDYADDSNGKTIIAWTELIEKPGASFSYHEDGRVGHYGDPHPCDLINIPEKRWVNVFEEYLSGPHRNRNLADIHAADVPDNRIACIEFTEGDGLEGEYDFARNYFTNTDSGIKT